MHFTSKKKIALVLALSIMAIVSVLSVDIDLCVKINKDLYYDGQEQGLSGVTSINNSNFAGKKYFMAMLFGHQAPTVTFMSRMTGD